MEWNPPGHGNIYTALKTTGLFKLLAENGFRYAFVSNVDNLGASLDTGLLGRLASQNTSFMMEVVHRTSIDKKGGHLARNAPGRLILREVAQVAPDEADIFQNIDRYCFFNTNNIWLNLEKTCSALDTAGGVFELPVISNEKHLDPRDKTSPSVYQIETAMGSAISMFSDSEAVIVPRGRFNPVKHCQDLLVAGSDCFRINENFSFDYVHAFLNGPFPVCLEPAYYGNYDDMQKHFPFGPPSMVECASLSINGDVYFGTGIKLRGDVRIFNKTGSAVHICDNEVIEGEKIYP
jgi:UTP--glucose-1-phosphate uridylyltransferase